MNLRAWIFRRLRPKSIGSRGEDAAAKYLKRHGYRILARHLDSPLGELDIIAVDGRTIVFVEVKTRSSSAAGSPADAIDPRKQQRMTQAALAYLKRNGLLKYSARFDVLAITWPADARRPTAIVHVRNAFEPTGKWQLFS